MSIYINKNTKVITQGITGKTGQFHTEKCQEYANGKNCFVAGVNPKKAGESIFNIPIYASVKEAAQQTGATVSVIYVPPAGAAAAIWEAVEADLDLAICITEGIPVRDMLEVRNKMKAKEAAGGKKTLLLGPNCPWHHHTRRNQDRHHARPHPPQGPHRRGQPLGHADL
jgi:succinyl-CoA synthetase alpha subunit